MSVNRTGFLLFSMLFALSVLGLLLSVATSPATDRLRLANNHIQYLQSAVTAAHGTVLQVAEDGRASDNLFTEIDSALVAGNDALRATLTQVYNPVGYLAQAQQLGIMVINWRDADTPHMSDAGLTLQQAEQVAQNVDKLTAQFAIYREEQAQFANMRTGLSSQGTQLLTALREQGDERTADEIYVISNKIESLLASSADAGLDQVFSLNGQLEQIETSLPLDLRGMLRKQINTIYTLNAMKRSMNEAVNGMNADGLLNQLGALSTVVEQDQHYVSGAVSDARILLNISTGLLLALLAVFGLRLQSSYAALNASHDDLEARVEERTHDLAQANHDLKESQVQLVQAEKMSSLGQLVAGVMHEINTPLLYVQNNTTMTAEAVAEVSNFVNLTLPLLSAQSNDQMKVILSRIAARRGELDPEEIAENLQEVASLATDSLDGLDQISELVQSLKDFSRLDRVADDKFDVREGIEKTLVITRNLLKQGVAVDLKLAQVPEIYCSPSRLNQVFINLVTNAVQAMEGQGKLTITTQWLHKGEGHESVEICFADTGCGIAPEHLDKIMDPFFTTKPVGQGTGLGLSIVRQIVEQHGGQILVDSKVEVGTRITLNFPTTAPQGANQDEEAA